MELAASRHPEPRVRNFIPGLLAPAAGVLRRSFPLFSLFAFGPVAAQPFQLPTANHALFEPGGEDRFFVGTTGKPWTSGCFGCVRSDGWQMHEGLDIRCLQRDKRGEPTDPVMATADGTVVYINSKPSLSNYGKYVVVRHRIEGLEIDSLYAHLSQARDGLKPGQEVKAGDQLAVVEAMKMQNVLKADRDVTVTKLKCKPGDSLAVDAVIMEFA